MSRDPETYPDPDNYMPERFLDADGQLDVNGKDPADFAFGFGRRYDLHVTAALVRSNDVILESQNLSRATFC